MADQIRVDHQVLQTFTADMFRAAELNQEDAAFYAQIAAHQSDQA